LVKFFLREALPRGAGGGEGQDDRGENGSAKRDRNARLSP